MRNPECGILSAAFGIQQAVSRIPHPVLQTRVPHCALLSAFTFRIAAYPSGLAPESRLLDLNASLLHLIGCLLESHGRSLRLGGSWLDLDGCWLDLDGCWLESDGGSL
jgi:hypothetical protein